MDYYSAPFCFYEDNAVLYFLTLPKQAGGQTAHNDRRAVIVSLPDETDPGDALAAARAVAAAADPGNHFSWAAATGGFMSDDSLEDFDGLLWLNVAAETPEVLTGDPGGGPAPLEPDQALIEDGDELDLLGETVNVSVENNEPSLSVEGTLAFVEHEQVIQITGGEVQLTVAGNAITGGTFSPE